MFLFFQTIIDLLRLIGTLIQDCLHVLRAIHRLLHAWQETEVAANRFLPVLGQIHHVLLELKAGQAIPEPPDPLRDKSYAMDRIGVSRRTIDRLTGKGKLPVAEVINGRNFYRESDIAACRRFYRG